MHFRIIFFTVLTALSNNIAKFFFLFFFRLHKRYPHALQYSRRVPLNGLDCPLTKEL